MLMCHSNTKCDRFLKSLCDFVVHDKSNLAVLEVIFLSFLLFTFIKLAFSLFYCLEESNFVFLEGILLSTLLVALKQLTLASRLLFRCRVCIASFRLFVNDEALSPSAFSQSKSAFLISSLFLFTLGIYF